MLEFKLKTLRDGRGIVEFSEETGLVGSDLLDSFLKEYTKEKAEEEIIKMVLVKWALDKGIIGR